MATMMNCPYCGKLTDRKLESCPHCGGYLSQAASPPAKTDTARQRQTCPACHALVQDGDIICVACGTNLLTGQKIVEEAGKGVAPRRISLWILLAVAAVLVGLLGVGIALYVASRNDLEQAIQLIATGHISEANQLLEQYVTENPEDARAYFELGKLQWRTRQWQKAASSFEKATDLDPKNKAAFLLGVASLTSLGEDRTRLREARLLQRFVQEYPEDVVGWYLLGLARGAGNNAAGQIEALERAIALNPSDPKNRQYLGIALAMEGKYAQAESELDAALQADPEDGDMLAAMGLVANLGDNDKEAETRLTAALDKTTAIETEALTQLGLLLIGQGRYEQAISHFTKVLAQDQDNPTAALFLAVCLQAEGLESDALREFEAIAERKGPYAAEAALQAAQIHLARDDVAAADRALVQAERLEARGPAWYTLRGRLHAKAGEIEAAQEMFRQAIQADPTYAPAHLESGLLYVKRRILSEGIRELERYLGLADPNAETARTKEVEALIEQLRQAGTAQV